MSKFWVKLSKRVFFSQTKYILTISWKLYNDILKTRNIFVFCRIFNWFYTDLDIKFCAFFIINRIISFCIYFVGKSLLQWLFCLLLGFPSHTRQIGEGLNDRLKSSYWIRTIRLWSSKRKTQNWCIFISEFFTHLMHICFLNLIYNCCFYCLSILVLC